MSENPNRLVNFWQQLKRRRVIHVIIVYATAAFVIIELVNNVYETLNLPDWTPAMTLVILIIGFPIVIIISWIFDITPKGLKKTNPVELTKNNKKGHLPSDKISRFENSIAVLPFQDMSPEKDQEYFCDGMSEEIINALSHVESLKVIARTSAFAFKDKQKDMREIGKKLDVENLLEGSIRKDSNRLRITAQLIKVADGSHLWSEKFDREIEDVFAIQDEIAVAIVDILKVKLLGEEKKAILNQYTNDLEAYDMYLMGNYWMRMFSAEGFIKAFEYYEQLISTAPNSPLGYMGLATVNIYSSFQGNVPPNEAYPKAKELLTKALDIDNTVTEAHAMLGIIELLFNWNWEAAEKKIKQALLLGPNSAETRYLYSMFLRLANNHDAAIAEAKRALELDPLSIEFNLSLGDTYFYAHQIDKAIDKFHSILTMDPNNYLARYGLGHAYEGKLMIPKAIREYEKAVDLSDGSPLAVSSLACGYYLIGEKEQAEKLYNSLLERSKKEYVPPVHLYSYHIIREDYDQAFDWLKKAIIEHDSSLMMMTICPTKGHRIPDEPRFKALLKKAGFEKYQQ